MGYTIPHPFAIVGFEGDATLEPRPIRPYKYLTDKNTVWDNNLIIAIMILIAGVTTTGFALQEMAQPKRITWRARRDEEKTKDELDEEQRKNLRYAQERSETIEH